MADPFPIEIAINDRHGYYGNRDRFIEPENLPAGNLRVKEKFLLFQLRTSLYFHFFFT